MIYGKRPMFSDKNVIPTVLFINLKILVKGFTYESLNLYNFFTTIGHQCSKWGLQGGGG